MTDPSNTTFDTELASLTELADQVISRANAQARTGPSDRVLVAVAGPPGSGKSTMADELVDLLNKRTPGSAAVLPMDGYHYDDLVLEQRGHIARKGAPHTFDVAGFAHVLGRLRVNDEAEVAVPVFDRSIEIARAGARIIPQSVSYLVVEGNYLLLDLAPWNDLARFFDLTVFIDVPEDELGRRLRERWADLPEVEADWKLEGNDLPNARLVLARRRSADFILRPSVP